MLRPAVLLAASLAVSSAYDNGAAFSRLPALGWSSWIGLGPGAGPAVFDFCDEFSVKAAADAFIDVGLFAAGYRHFHLDDCWAGGRNATGYLYADTTNFPNGMKAVADYVHSKGLVFGIYTCAGTETCVGGRPGSKDHWAQDAAIWAEWGIDDMKMDWCNTEGMDPLTTYTTMSKALNATGHAVLFNLCEWGVNNPWQWAAPIAQSWRMAGDHEATWASTKSVIASSAAIPAKYTGQAYAWNDMDMLETGCYDQCAHANGKAANMTADEYITEFSMWAISASPLVVTTRIMNCSSPAPAPAPTCALTLTQQLSKSPCTLGTSYGCAADNASMWTSGGCRGVFECNGASTTCDVNGTGTHACACGPAPPVTCVGWLSELQKSILLNEEAIAINQDVTPQGRPVAAGDSTVWARALSDGSVAVALFNADDAPAAIRAVFASWGWPAGTAAAARDLWAHADLGTFTDAYPAGAAGVTVAPHATRLIRFTKV